MNVLRRATGSPLSPSEGERARERGPFARRSSWSRCRLSSVHSNNAIVRHHPKETRSCHQSSALSPGWLQGSCKHVPSMFLACCKLVTPSFPGSPALSRPTLRATKPFLDASPRRKSRKCALPLIRLQSRGGGYTDSASRQHPGAACQRHQPTPKPHRSAAFRLQSAQTSHGFEQPDA